MAAVVEVWMSELGKLKEKVGAKKRLVLSSKAKQGDGDEVEQQQQEQQEFKEAREESSRMVQIQRDLDSSSLSEDTVRLLMDRFVPW
ncbi:TMV resistance protein N-like [Pyrus ussuriensis x Pyrus communis]|uniref:TMV resistance protein N-like n=1 Tax=Pyrus ussuriensis x Pyrus communis TaxID=2448454 RepID=A0A5N5G325_9ROSA|nr:TMV resistance protein N-like [Pyrus ussuriensis x Pyrus communis]